MLFEYLKNSKHKNCQQCRSLVGAYIKQYWVLGKEYNTCFGCWLVNITHPKDRRKTNG